MPEKLYRHATMDPSEPYRRKLSTLFAVSLASIQEYPPGDVSSVHNAG
jgi:hypothetical protein